MSETIATNGICLGRANKMTYNLVSWRRFIGPYVQNTIADLYAGIAKMKSFSFPGHPFKQTLKENRWLKGDLDDCIHEDLLLKDPSVWQDWSEEVTGLLSDKKKMNFFYLNLTLNLVNLATPDGDSPIKGFFTVDSYAKTKRHVNS